MIETQAKMQYVLVVQVSYSGDISHPILGFPGIAIAGKVAVSFDNAVDNT